MTAKTRRRLRRFRRKAAAPIAYILILGLGLAVFLVSMHSCGDREPPATGGVQIITENR